VPKFLIKQQNKVYLYGLLQKKIKKELPVFSLYLTNALTQVFLFSTISQSVSSAFDFVIYIATLAFLIPYLISSLYQLKLTITGETYLDLKQRWTDGVIACIAAIYSIWVIYSGSSDIKTFLFGVVLLVSGVFFYPLLRDKEKTSTV